MVVILDPRRPRPFVLPEDLKLPLEQRTTWMVRGLTSREMSWIRDIQSGEDGYRIGATLFHRFRLGVVGWQNLMLGSSLLEFRTQDFDLFGKKVQVVHDEIMDAIPDPVVQTIQDEIQRLSRLVGEDIKSPAPRGAAGNGAAPDGLRPVPGT